MSEKTASSARARLVVLISGGGTNLQAVLDACASGALGAEVVAVISDREGAFGLERARRAGVVAEVFVAPRRATPAQRRAYDAALAERVATHRPDRVVLAGWMRILTSDLLNRFPKRIMNLHPALPGELPGMRAIARAFEEAQRGLRTRTGVMVHEVVPEVDAGPVILAREVPILPTDTLDTLEARVHTAEHAVLVEALQRHLSDHTHPERDRMDQVTRIEVTTRAAWAPAHGWLEDAQALGVEGLEAVEVSRLYFVRGDLSTERAATLAQALLADPVVDAWHATPAGEATARTPAQGHVIEVIKRPGVTDTAGDALVAAARGMGFGEDEVAAAASGARLVLHGALDEDAAALLSTKLFANEVVEQVALNHPARPTLRPPERTSPVIAHIPIREADDQALADLSATRRLALSVEELRAVQAYFVEQGREPTDAELEMIAQTWSEHCVHKTFRAQVTLCEVDAAGVERHSTIPSLFDTYIKAATEAVAARLEPGWLRSVFKDDAGIVGFDERFELALKVETHNHPSALEPFGGANTGIGGVVRDILGVSARPIANLDVLCFGPEDLRAEALPEGVLHPRRVARGVLDGIEDYGNKMGIPTVAGALVFDEGYIANPLVFCGTLGLLPRGSHRAAPRAGDLLVAIGGATGRDGIGGATFSSMGMDHTTSSLSGSAVQIGRPIEEKQVMEVILQARDEGLYSALTDCGAGGFSSSVGELAATLGASVSLDDVPLKYAGLHPWEIWLSEAQERMVLAVPPAHRARLDVVCAAHGVTATTLGRLTGDGVIRVTCGDEALIELGVGFLHGGRPPLTLSARWEAPAPEAVAWPEALDAGALLCALLAEGQTRCKADVLRRFDHEVQGGTIVKPVTDQGHNDAAVLLPLDALRAAELAGDTPRAVALSVGVNPAYGVHDPYAMSWAVVDEAIRNAVAVGADPARVALLDNFCWGNPRLPDRMGALTLCARGCHDAALAYTAPFISGKDSLNNEYIDAEGQRRAIPGTLLISALAIVPDAARVVTADLKAPGDLLYIVGATRDELGGSAVGRALGLTGGVVPQPAPEAPEAYRALHGAMRAGLVRACHDLSQGGLAVAVAEVALAGGLGARVRLADVPMASDAPLSAHALAFSESSGRLLVEVAPGDRAAFEAHMTGVRFAHVGEVLSEGFVQLVSGDGEWGYIQLTLSEMRAAWAAHL